MNPKALQVAKAVGEHWVGLQADTSGDELTAGGQSVKELERIEAFEAFLLTGTESTEIPTYHEFADGIYIRRIHAPKDSVLIGHEHRHECINIMLMGHVLTITNGEVSEFTAPWIGKSGPGTRKASIVVQDMIWLTVHPNPDNERDIAKLEERLLIKSRAFLEYESRRNPPPKV